MKTLSGIALLIILVVATNLQAADSFCGELDPPRQYGPYDYANPVHRKENLPVVERGHFTPDVKNLIKGESTTNIGGDISYTLRAFPNHYKALWSMVMLSLREKTTHVKGAKYTVGCFFERAMRFKPTDGMVRMIYGNYLQKIGRPDGAIEQYHEAINLQPGNANINYNLGLMYLKRKDYGQAIVYAKKAYELGFPLPGLRNQLMKTGKWDGKLDEEVRDEVDENVDEKIDVEPQK